MARIVPALTLDGLAAAPWALDRAVLAELVNYAQRGETLTEAIRAAMRPAQPQENRGAISVIPIHGMIEHRSSVILDLFGGSSIEDIRAALRASVANPQVSAIVLDIDSPGGGVAGVTELAAEIRAARAHKRVVAVANTTAGSAAYWLGAQASQFLVTPSGMVGSVGIYAVHLDFSKHLEAEGVTPTLVSAGERKGDGSPAFPLSDEARAAMQSRADTFLAQFEGDLAKGRGISVEKVRASFGRGAVFLAQEAVAAGLVDKIGTLDEAMRLASRPLSSNRAEADELDPAEVDLPFRARVEQMSDELTSLVEHAAVRASLRAKEGRPSFSEPTEVALRSIRDGLSALLPVEPVADAAPTPPPVDPPKAVVQPTPRFRSAEDWARYIQEITH